MTQAIHQVDAPTVAGWLAGAERGDVVTVVDVRTPAEFESAHIRGSYNVPLRLLDEHADQLRDRLGHRVVLVCQSGIRADQARKRLAAVGMEGLHVLDGGVPAYAAAGGNVVYGRSRWSIERQVRLVAGLLVLVGTLTSLVVPWMLAVAVFVGAGLTFAGLTDNCMMGRLLARLPYNRGEEPSAETVLGRLPKRKAA
ncbi:Rhodanese-related sulfurtransferase [Actinopolymorpha cephalotaxi]|uniref:Rhodanese-related sulfurtransferase n=1 Tax=Actinopolymorpha cephalotaxi TaxID=504797 RepID=A0A1I2XFA3_9ACTN|nr:rhodanese-like domain-containing protein [Actinopolymorpha cephalotaxi]NYH86157.1 rhodanese-related sulfurtransferase [Actinopolymorpha cephalotaxi]SFH10741.1 Rhodanese-related sulfurtransferase [Actinopolymorpha cephalotaxi]